MSTLVGLRKYHRSAKVGIGSKDLTSDRTTWVNVENPRSIRDLARHISIGQFFVSQPARFQLDTAQVTQGGLVTPRTGSLTLDVSAANLKYLKTDSVYTADATASYAAGTQAVTPNATNPLVAAIGFDTSTPATPTTVALNGTAAATVLESRFQNAYATLAANPALESTANRTWLALVWVPPALTGITSVASTEVITTGSAHGYSVGDPVWFNGLTGGAGFTENTLYYVNSVPSTTTFTVSATLGGSTHNHTSNLTAGTVQRQILASDIFDIRP